MQSKRWKSWRKRVAIGLLVGGAYGVCTGTGMAQVTPSAATAAHSSQPVTQERPASTSKMVVYDVLDTAAQGNTEFMPVSEVRPGMTGIAKTVVEGNTIQSFPVKVLGIMKNRGPSGDLILAEFSGPIIDESGGIAHGMSGSPVYINGKLVGAVAYGWGFSRSHVGMIAPIEQMLQLLDMPYQKDIAKPFTRDSRLLPLGTPLMAYGFDGNALQFLQNKLSDYAVSAYDTASVAEDSEAQPIYPGSSIAATLIDGDLKLGAIGTVTYVGPRGIVAFGHPYLKEGASGYFLHNSYVFTVINSVESSFKLGSIGANIGAITEDRGAGIAGKLGIAPANIPMGILTRDDDRGVTKDSSVHIVDDGALTPALATTAVYNFLTKTMDRKGGGTATIQYTIRPSDDSLPTYKRTDMFYKRNGIAMESVDDFYDIVDKLMNNRFRDYPIRDIDVSVDVTKEQRTAHIIDATVTPAVVQPGDEVAVTVSFLPYRGEVEKRTVTYVVPKDQAPGEVLLEIRGGGVIPLPYLIQRQRLNLTDEVIRRLHTYKNFDEYFKQLSDIERNNQIIVEILQKGVSRVEGEKGESEAKATLAPGVHPETKPAVGSVDGGNSATSKDDEDTPKAIINTPYVMFRDVQVPLQVVDAAHYDAAVKAFVKKRMAEKKETGDTAGTMDAYAKAKKELEDTTTTED